MQNPAVVGRVLLASLHQAIAEAIPARLEFYEPWLAPSDPREQTLDLESFAAMLSFLQQEGDARQVVVTSAGDHAAVRCYAELSLLKRAGLHLLPRRLRAPKVMRLAVGLLTELYPESRIDMTSRGATIFINIDGSPFCAGPEPAARASCGFYTGALSTFLRLFGLEGSVKVSRCRASGSKNCLLMVLPGHALHASVAEGSLLGLEAPPVHAAEDLSPPLPPAAKPPASLPTPITDPIAVEVRWSEITSQAPDVDSKKPAASTPDSTRKVTDTDGDPEAPWHQL